MDRRLAAAKIVIVHAGQIVVDQRMGVDASTARPARSGCAGTPNRRPKSRTSRGRSLLPPPIAAWRIAAYSRARGGSGMVRRPRTGRPSACADERECCEPAWLPSARSWSASRSSLKDRLVRFATLAQLQREAAVECSRISARSFGRRGGRGDPERFHPRRHCPVDLLSSRNSWTQSQPARAPCRPAGSRSTRNPPRRR